MFIMVWLQKGNVVRAEKNGRITTAVNAAGDPTTWISIGGYPVGTACSLVVLVTADYTSAGAVAAGATAMVFGTHVKTIACDGDAMRFVGEIDHTFAHHGASNMPNTPAEQWADIRKNDIFLLGNNVHIVTDEKGARAAFAGCDTDAAYGALLVDVKAGTTIVYDNAGTAIAAAAAAGIADIAALKLAIGDKDKTNVHVGVVLAAVNDPAVSGIALYSPGMAKVGGYSGGAPVYGAPVYGALIAPSVGMFSGGYMMYFILVTAIILLIFMLIDIVVPELGIRNYVMRKQVPTK